MLRNSMAWMVVRADARARVTGWWKVARMSLLATMTALLASTAGAAVGSSYLYDELGRILEVTTLDGNTAQYKYDPSGNLVSVTSVGGALTVADFTPRAGVVGDTVVITGSGFSTTSLNTVTFGAGSTSAIATTSTQLTVTVPTGATTSTLTVSSPTHSVTTTAQFTVLGSSPVPTISSFTPNIGPAGTAVQVNGKNFDLAPTNDQLSFGATQASVSSATATKLQTTVPIGAGSGGLLIRTSAGGLLSKADFFAVPAVYATANVVAGSRIAMNGTATTPTLAAGQVAMMLFDLTAGQSAALSVTLNASQQSFNEIRVTDPKGQSFFVATGAGSSSTNVVVLPQAAMSGTYSVIVNLGATNTGSATLGLTPQGSSSMSIDQPSPLHLTHASPAPPIAVTFNNLTPAKQVTLTLAAALAFSGDVHIVAPDGNPVVGLSNIGIAAGSSYALAPQLPLPGQYTILIASNSGAAYDLSLTLATSAAPGVTINGAPATVTVSQPSGAQSVTFSALAGQQITVTTAPQSAPTGFTANLQVRDPTGQALQLYPTSDGNSGSVASVPSYLSVTPLGVTSSGLYTIQLKPTSNKGAGVQVSVTTPVVAGVLSSNGQPVQVTPGLAGQGIVFTFLGNDAPMTLTVGVSMPLALAGYASLVSVVDQFGLPVGPSGLSAGLVTNGSNGSLLTGSTSLSIPALPQGSVYQILVQQTGPSDTNTATLTFTLH